MRVSHKISLSFLITAVVLTIGASSVYFFVTGKVIKKEISNQFEALVKAKQNHINTYLMMLKIAVGQLSRSTLISSFLESDKDSPSRADILNSVISRLKRTKEANPSIEEFAVLDTNGMVVASSIEKNIGMDMSKEAIFIGGQNGTYIKDAYYSFIENRSLLGVSTPIFSLNDKNKLIGVLIASVGLEDLNSIVTDKTGMQETGEMYIVNKFGYMITPSRFIPDSFLKQRVNTSNYKHCLVHRDSEEQHKSLYKEGRISKDYRKINVVGTHKYIDEMQWCLLAEIDEEEAMHPLNIIKRILLVIIVITPLVAWFIGLLVGLVFTMPLKKLNKGMEIIGHGNLDHRIKINTKDEIGQLSKAFDKMAEDLQKTSVSKEYVDNVIESMTDFLIVIDTKGIIETVNSAVCGILGYSREELIGQDVSLLFVVEEEEEEEFYKGKKFRKLISEGKIINQETNFKSKNGKVIPVVLSGAVMKDESDAVTNIVCIAKDITERKLAEEALEQSDKRFMDVLHSSSDAILLIDEETFVDANEATARMLKYSNREEFLMTHPSELSPPMQPDGQSSFDKANEMMRIACEQGFNRFEWMHKKKTGENFPVEVSLTPITYKGKTVIHCLWRDLTEIKKTEEEIKKANNELIENEKALKNILYDMKKTQDDLKSAQAQLVQSEKLSSLGQLSAGIAHEINNPLGFISNNIDILEEYIESYSQILRATDILKKTIIDKDFDKAILLVEEIKQLEEKVNLDFITSDIENLIRQSKSGTERIKKIVQDLRTFARKDEGQMELNNIEEVLDGVINIVWNEIKYTAELKKEYGGLPLVKCNSQKLGQVFINLLVNAAQAIKEKGTITVKTYVEKQHACIQISDTGCGIPKENIDKIFDPFFTTKPVGKGTGLGLSIGYDIIKQHKGELKVESEPNVGTTFIVKLPTK